MKNQTVITSQWISLEDSGLMGYAYSNTIECPRVNLNKMHGDTVIKIISNDGRHPIIEFKH